MNISNRPSQELEVVECEVIKPRQAIESEYDDKYLCKECQGENEILITATDGGYISECDTICKECKQKDYWAYGFYLAK